MRFNYSNMFIVIPALFAMTLYRSGRESLILMDHPIHNYPVQSWVNTLNLSNISFSGLMMSLVFICLIHIAISAGTFTTEDINYAEITQVALRLLGVNLNPNFVNAGMPYFIPTNDFFYFLPHLVLEIFRISPAGILAVASGYYIPEGPIMYAYGIPDESFNMWVSSIILTYPAFLQQFGVAPTEVGAFYAIISRFVFHFLEWRMTGTFPLHSLHINTLEMASLSMDDLLSLSRESLIMRPYGFALPDGQDFRVELENFFVEILGDRYNFGCHVEPYLDWILNIFTL